MTMMAIWINEKREMLPTIHCNICNYSDILSALELGKTGIPQYVFLHNSLHFRL